MLKSDMSNRPDERSMILVADDDKSVRAYLKRAFEKEGFAVVGSGTVEDAVRQLQDQSFDAVFSDIVMASGDDGIELLKTASALQPDTPVILITGQPKIETASLAVRFNAYDYLTKPLSHQILIQVARNAVETKKLREEKKRVEERNQAYRRKLEQSMAERTLELRISRERYRSLFAASKDAIFVVSADGRLIDMNKACMDILGYEHFEMKRMYFRDFFLSPGLGSAIFRLVSKQGYLEDYEVELRKADCEIRQCVLSVKTLGLVKTGVREFQVIIRDVTPQKEAEAKIRESQAQLMLLRAAIEQFSDSVIVTDDQGVCLYANLAFEKIAGRPRKEVIGKTPFILRPGEHHGKDYDRMRQTIEGGNRWERNYVLSRQDGNLYEEEAVVFPVFDDSGKIASFVIVEKDVTEKRKLENVAEAANMMENTGFIFAGIRHEIGNPINSLLTTLTVLERKLDSLPKETVRQFIGGAISETGRVRFLLSALKNFNLFENPKTRNLELNRFVADFQSLIRKDFSDKGIAVEAEFSSEETWALLDPRAFHHVLLNLMTNAADALEGREGPRIVMRVATAGDSVTVQIQDNGCGLSPGLQKQLFTPFFTTKVQGTGLGLVIVKKLLLKMNSHICVESERDAGTTITLTIPGGRSDE